MTLAKGVVVAHTDSADNLLSHWEQVHHCHASGVALQVVGIDTEFNASSKTGSNRRPILRHIGLCYVDSAHRMVMISVDTKVVGKMTSYDTSRVTT